MTVSSGTSREVDKFARLGFCAPAYWGRGRWGQRTLREIEMGDRVLIEEEKQQRDRIIRILGLAA